MVRQRAAALTKTKIDPTKLLKEVENPGAGGVVLFLGTVRNHSDAGSVTRIEYEAYETMAEKSLAKTEKDVRRRWPDTKGVRIIHRVGRLSVGDISVAIAISSPHRAEAFEACRYAIEAVKHDAPIWKRERLAGGKEVWVESVPVGSRTEAGRGAVSGRQRSARGRGLAD